MKLNKLSVLEAHSERLNGANLLSWMECLLGPICLFSLFILPFSLTDVQRRNCAVQLIRMHTRQLSLLSRKLIKQMPPYPTFYKEQHVIDSSLARKRLYFNFDWLGSPTPQHFPPFPPKRRGEGDFAQANDLAMTMLDLIVILCMQLKAHLEFFCRDWGMPWACFYFCFSFFFPFLCFKLLFELDC